MTADATMNQESKLGGAQAWLNWVLATFSVVIVFGLQTERSSRPLFYSTDVATLRAQYLDNPVLHELSEETRLVVSEPLGDLAGVWNEVPESSYVLVQEGEDELRLFSPAPA